MTPAITICLNFGTECLGSFGNLESFGSCGTTQFGHLMMDTVVLT